MANGVATKPDVEKTRDSVKLISKKGVGKRHKIFCTIKPAPNSRKLATGVNGVTEMIENRYGIKSNGEKELISSSSYDAQRFDDTLQFETASWSSTQGKYLIIDPDDPTKSKVLDGYSEKLNKMVSKCNLHYEKDYGEFKRGQLIKQCDIFDFYDPFLNHTKFRMSFKQGERIVPLGWNDGTGEELNQLLVLAFRASKRFAVGSGLKTQKISSNVRYIIVDKNVERKEKVSKRSLDLQARNYFDKLSEEKIIKISIALGLVSNPNIEYSTIEDLLWSYITNTIEKVPGGLTKQENFVKLVESGVDNIEIHYLFNDAKAKGIIKKIGGTYSAFGTNLGKTVAEAINKLKLDSSEKLRNKITEAIEVFVTNNK